MYTFIAIVAHYVNVKGELGKFICPLFCLILILTPTEELLIDFKELLGTHSGENMAEAVWDTLTTYGIKDQVSVYFALTPLLSDCHIFSR